MKKITIALLFLILPLACFAQFIGIGTQYTDVKGEGNNIQFAANVSYPVWHKKNPINSFISSGVDFTGGKSSVSGLNIKPIQMSSFIDESLFNNKPFTILVNCDAGYLFNFGHEKDGIVISPNLYMDYKFVFIKSGFDFNVTGGEKQFYVRAGFCFGMSSTKQFAKTTVW